MVDLNWWNCAEGKWIFESRCSSLRLNVFPWKNRERHLISQGEENINLYVRKGAVSDLCRDVLLMFLVYSILHLWIWELKKLSSSFDLSWKETLLLSLKACPFPLGQLAFLSQSYWVIASFSISFCRTSFKALFYSDAHLINIKRDTMVLDPRDFSLVWN